MESLLELINTYGLSAFVVAGIAFLVWKVVNAKIERKKDAQEAEQKLKEEESKAKIEAESRDASNKQVMQILETNTELIKQLIEDNVKQHQHTVAEQNDDIRINTFIFDRLKELLDLSCDRAYYIKMHNGGKDIMGRGFLKMSISAEAVDSDTAPIMAKFQNIPRTMLFNLYSIVNDKDEYDVQDSAEIKKDDALTYQFLKEHGAKCAIFRPIKADDGLLIGIVAVEYNDLELGKANFDIAKRVMTQVAREINGAIKIEAGSHEHEHFV